MLPRRGKAQEDLIPTGRHRLAAAAPGNLTLDLLLLGPTPTGESATVSTTSPGPEGQRRQGRPPTETGAHATASLNCWWERRKEFVAIFSNWRDYYVIIIIIIIHLKCANMWLVFGECGGRTVTLVEKEEQQRTNLRGMIREYLEEFTISWLPSSSLLICRISILSHTQRHSRAVYQRVGPSVRLGPELNAADG